MSQKIGFLLSKSSLAKSFAPIIIEALSSGQEVFLLCYKQENFDQDFAESVNNSYSSYTPRFCQLLYYDNYDELPALAKQLELNLVFDFDFQSRLDQVPVFKSSLLALRSSGVKICCLQNYGDFLSMRPDAFSYLDYFFIYSKRLIAMYQQLYPEAAKETVDKFIAVGNINFDSFAVMQKKEVICAKYHLDPHKKIVLFMSQNIPYCESSSRLMYIVHCLRRDLRSLSLAILGPSYSKILELTKHWSDANDAELVYKTRIKNQDPSFVSRLVSKLVSDQNRWYPPANLELMTIADVVFSFSSSTALEAAFLHRPHISINLPEMLGLIKKNNFDLFFNNSFFDHPGVTKQLTAGELEDFLAKNKLSDLSSHNSACQDYLKNYLEQPANSSRAILDFLKTK